MTSKRRKSSANAESSVFGYSLVICSDFAQVLKGEGRAHAISEVARLALSEGRVLIQARGGAGKTTVLHRVLKHPGRSALTSARLHCILINVLDWYSSDRYGQSLQKAVESSPYRSTNDAVTTSSLSSRVETVILLDGLNEVPDQAALKLLEEVEELTSRNPHLGVVVTDRLTRRPVGRLRWVLSTLTPVPAAQVHEILALPSDQADIGVLDNPFYLERARHQGRDLVSLGDIHRAYFHQLGFSSTQIQTLGEATLQQYRIMKGRTIDLDILASAAGSEVVDRLKSTGLVVNEDNVFRYVHHLIGDFLVVVPVVDLPARWTREIFDALTFSGSSFDPLTILLEETEADKRDQLLRRIHDWNFYASSYLLTQVRRSHQAVAPAVELVLLAMLAEKRFDRIKASVEQAEDVLSAYPTPLARRFLEAESLSAVIDIVSGQWYDTEWFPAWYNIFTHRPGEPSTDSDVFSIIDSEGVVAWSAANMLRRALVTKNQLLQIRALIAESDPIARWRVVHVLGAHPSSDSADLLFDRLQFDDYIWVRYGALRSIIEQAATVNEDNRQALFERFATYADFLLLEPALLRGIERDLLVSDAPSDWADSTGLLLERLWAGATSVSEQDRWRALGARLRLTDTGWW
jgi:hypothetical protein